MMIAVREVALENAESPIDVRRLPVAKLTVARLLAPSNVFARSVVTPAGMVIAERALALKNAYIPMYVNWLPVSNVTVVSALAL
jgi:hypothetical protein